MFVSAAVSEICKLNQNKSEIGYILTPFLGI